MGTQLRKLIYVGDPMCSWCWGFAPEIESLAAQYQTEVVVGGLRPGPSAQPLDERLAAFLRHHWLEIAERTSQPFDTRFLERNDGWVYDTEPAAIAIVVMRELSAPDTLRYFSAVQRAFYSEGGDVTDFDLLAELASRFPIDSEDFRRRLGEAESKRRAWSDFSRARNWGISGFPTLVGELEDQRLALLARGWTPAQLIRSRIASLSEAAVG